MSLFVAGPASNGHALRTGPDRPQVRALQARVLRRAHVHALVAGSLFVLALFMATAVPFALASMARGEAGLAMGAYPVLFVVLVFLGYGQARRWRQLTASTAA